MGKADFDMDRSLFHDNKDLFYMMTKSNLKCPSTVKDSKDIKKNKTCYFETFK
jgi:hypothetical protein